jgi:hypothetical protein
MRTLEEGGLSLFPVSREVLHTNDTHPKFALLRAPSIPSAGPAETEARKVSPVGFLPPCLVAPLRVTR